MTKELSYTIEEVAQLLKVSKLTIYDLVKKGELPVFRVGRQMRMDAKDLDNYINNQKSRVVPAGTAEQPNFKQKESLNVVISGQDLVLDILGKHIEKYSTYKTLRSYTGSLNSLISMYHGECDIVSLHMFDGDTGEYNIPYLKKILTGHSYILLNLLSRKAGFYVQKGNPLQIRSWTDLAKKDVKIINREKGAGARILLDEQLRIHQISPRSIAGYENEETSHLSVASAVSARQADVGIGIEKAAQLLQVDFVPLITERYDLVILKIPENKKLISTVQTVLSSPSFQSEINSLGGYDYSQTGDVLYETF